MIEKIVIAIVSATNRMSTYLLFRKKLKLETMKENIIEKYIYVIETKLRDSFVTLFSFNNKISFTFPKM